MSKSVRYFFSGIIMAISTGFIIQFNNPTVYIDRVLKIILVSVGVSTVSFLLIVSAILSVKEMETKKRSGDGN